MPLAPIALVERFEAQGFRLGGIQGKLRRKIRVGESLGVVLRGNL
jgi:hypothetical protein